MFTFRDPSSLPQATIALIVLLSACGEGGCSSGTSPTNTSTAGLATLTGTNFQLPSVYPVGGIAVGADSNLWLASCPSGSGAMMKITTSGQTSSYVLPAGVVRCQQWVVLGSDGAIWFTEFGTNLGSTLAQLGRIDVNGNIIEFALPAGDEPLGIASGKDGNLWYDAYTSSSFTNPVYVRGFSPTTHNIVGSVSNNLLSTVRPNSNTLVTNPADGDIIVSGGDPVFRVVPGIAPTIAGNISLPSGCGTLNGQIVFPLGIASVGTDSNFYFQCGNAVFARVSQASYSTTIVSEQLTFQGMNGTYRTDYTGPIFQGSNGILYTSGGYGQNGVGLTAILSLSTGGTLTGYYPSDEHDQAVQGVVGPDGSVWITIENLEGRTAVLTRINP